LTGFSSVIASSIWRLPSLVYEKKLLSMAI